jgi:hypothetical protein
VPLLGLRMFRVSWPPIRPNGDSIKEGLHLQGKKHRLVISKLLIETEQARPGLAGGTTGSFRTSL